MKNLPLALIGVLLVLGVAALIWVWNSPGDAPRPGSSLGDSPGSNGSAPKSEATPSELAEEKMATLKLASERIAHLDWLAGQDWIRSNAPLLRKTIVADPEESVQIRAVEVALQLAAKEGGNATTPVVKTALASNKGNTRARGLKAARENPDTNLVPTLLELVDNRDPYAAMALNALAYTPDDRARERITAMAKDTNADPQVRARAVALISVTRDEEGHRYLVELANDSDETLRKLATNILREWNN